MSDSYTLQAAWVVPVSEPPIRRGSITVENGRIVQVGPARAGQTARELGQVAVLPGLVNAHAHLELSDLTRPLGHRGVRLPEWIGLVLRHRSERRVSDGSAVARGMDEALEAGTSAIADIAHGAPPALERRPAAQWVHLALLEMIGWHAPRVCDSIDRAVAFLDAAAEPGASDNPLARRGLAPHAPFTVNAELLTACIRLATRYGATVAMHLAESPEELDLLAGRGGPLADLMQRAGDYRPSDVLIGARPLDYLDVLAEAPRSLVIHGNYLDNEEIDVLAARRDRMAVVYCPRSHQWFQHAPYPLRRMLEAGCRVAIGTDSRGSCESLDMRQELRRCAAAHAEVSGEQIIRMATIDGAAALGLPDRLGTIETGRTATFSVWPIQHHREFSYDQLLGRE